MSNGYVYALTDLNGEIISTYRFKYEYIRKAISRHHKIVLLRDLLNSEFEKLSN